jgi:hypothetical protein
MEKIRGAEGRPEVALFGIGAGDGKVIEQSGAVVSRRYAISWKRQELDLTELAKSRWIERLTVDDLALKFKVGRSFVVSELARIRREPNLVLDGSARRLVKLKERRFLGR